MIISGVTTLVAIAAVIGVIGYRVFRAEGSAGDVTATLPKGARVIATAVADDRIVVTIEIGGALEIRTFDLKTLKPAGRLRFATEPDEALRLHDHGIGSISNPGSLRLAAQDVALSRRKQGFESLGSANRNCH